MNREEEKLYKELKQPGKATAEFGRQRGIPLHRLYQVVIEVVRVIELVEGKMAEVSKQRGWLDKIKSLSNSISHSIITGRKFN